LYQARWLWWNYLCPRRRNHDTRRRNHDDHGTRRRNYHCS
jgi:hypothetical protein